jgi:hypothetical protein
LSGGWVSNSELGIEGVVSGYADPHSAEGMTSNLTAPVASTVVNACIKGTAAKVDMLSVPCTTKEFTPPATDCYGEFWGAVIGMNLKQPLDPETGEAVAKPLTFDASALKGFSFEIDGPTVPRPAAFRFKVEAETGEFCNPATVKIVAGKNRVLFSQLLDSCFRIRTDPPNPTAETVQSKLIKISWQVVTNANAEVPFDFCVSNVRALLK